MVKSDIQAEAARDRDGVRPIKAPPSPATERAKGACALAWTAAVVSKVVEYLLDIHGFVWSAVLLGIAAVWVATFVLWIALAFHDAGGVRTWLAPAFAAVAATAALVLLSVLLG